MRQWQPFWFAEVAPHPFALLRILFGLLGLIGLLGLTPVFSFWTPAGIVPVSGTAAEMKAWLVSRDLASAAGLMFFSGLIISFVGMLLGYFTRLTVAACFLGSLIQTRWNPLPLSAGNQVMIAVLFCLVWAETGAVWSVDALRHRGSTRPSTQAIWPLRLIQIQIALVYLSSGLWKLLFSSVWRDGSALQFVLQQNVFTRLPAPLSPTLDPLLTIASYVILVWELAFAPMLLRPWSRRLALASGVILHLGMWVTLEVGLFSWIMIASYTAFLEPSRLGNFFHVNANGRGLNRRVMAIAQLSGSLRSSQS